VPIILSQCKKGYVTMVFSKIKDTITKHSVSVLFCLAIVSTGLILVLSIYRDVASDDSVVAKGDFVVHVVNVGQGDAVMVVLPTNETILIDSGSAESSNILLDYIGNLVVGGKKIVAFDYAILTHPDEDHCGGLPSVLQKYSVKKFFRPNIRAGDLLDLTYTDPESSLQSDVYTTKTQAYRRAIDSIYKNSDQVFVNKYGQVQLNGHTNNVDNKWGLDIYSYGTKDIVGTVDNNYSPIMVLTCRQKKFVFCGDADGKILNRFVDDQEVLGIDALNADSIMLAHHGSSANDANNLEFLEFVVGSNDSTVALISVGLNNYAHPSPQVLSTLNDLGIAETNIYRTDHDGTVCLGVNDVGSMLVDTLGFGTVVYYKNIQAVCIVLVIISLSLAFAIVVAIVGSKFFQKMPKNRLA